MSIPTKPREDGRTPCAEPGDCNEPAVAHSAYCEQHQPGYSGRPKNGPIPARIVGGPIEFRDYDHLRLAVDHTVVLPDGSTLALPAGALLIMNKPGGHIEQKGGVATKNERAADARDGSS